METGLLQTLGLPLHKKGSIWYRRRLSRAPNKPNLAWCRCHALQHEGCAHARMRVQCMRLSMTGSIAGTWHELQMLGLCWCTCLPTGCWLREAWLSCDTLALRLLSKGAHRRVAAVRHLGHLGNAGRHCRTQAVACSHKLM